MNKILFFIVVCIELYIVYRLDASYGYTGVMCFFVSIFLFFLIVFILHRVNQINILAQLLNLDSITKLSLRKKILFSSVKNTNLQLNAITTTSLAVCNITSHSIKNQNFIENLCNLFSSKNFKVSFKNIQEIRTNATFYDCIQSIKNLGDNVDYHFFDSVIESVARVDGTMSIKEKFFFDAFRKVTGRTKNIAIIGTMSSGKSTLINALLRDDILPSENQACTSTVFKIEHSSRASRPLMRYMDSVDGVSEWYDVGAAELQAWNREKDHGVEILANFLQIENIQKCIDITENAQICTVLYDTPGPNNSMDNAHAKTTRTVLESVDFKGIIITLNTRYFGTTDEQHFLQEYWNIIKVKEERGGEIPYIIFALNQFDTLDFEKENPVEFLAKVRTYLENIGFKKPAIFPISAKTALLIRSLRHANSTGNWTKRKQKKLLDDIELLLESDSIFMDLLSDIPCYQEIMEDVHKSARSITTEKYFSLANQEVSLSNLNKAEILTGIPLLEVFINFIVHEE